MRLNSVLPSKINRFEWYHADINNVEECYIQDTVHILTKLRTRFLKEGVVLAIGNFKASVDHLFKLLANFSKDRHLLTKSDLKSEDKMNYQSAARMCSPLVTKLLEECKESKGTIAYLKIMYSRITAFLDENVNISTRLYNIWYCVFFLRLWRTDLLRKKEFTLKDNFITSNCYLCI